MNIVLTSFAEDIKRRDGDVTKTGTVVWISFVTIIFVKIHVLELVDMEQTAKCSIELPFVLVQVDSLEMQ